ncbi:hypothetical protein STEG23_021845 [Scotinomys teguina]
MRPGKETGPFRSGSVHGATWHHVPLGGIYYMLSNRYICRFTQDLSPVSPGRFVLPVLTNKDYMDSNKCIEHLLTQLREQHRSLWRNGIILLEAGNFKNFILPTGKSERYPFYHLITGELSHPADV